MLWSLDKEWEMSQEKTEGKKMSGTEKQEAPRKENVAVSHSGGSRVGGWFCKGKGE
jgi:hypothetical protein